MGRERRGGGSDRDVAEESESWIGGEFVEFVLTVLFCTAGVWMLGES